MSEQSNYCAACGALMYPARLLKGYADTDEPERMTCALHGPRGPYRHLGADREARCS